MSSRPEAPPPPHDLVKEQTQLARPLRVLVPLIKRELEAGHSASAEHYRAVGAMLIEAKQRVRGELGHGNWGAWLDRNFSLSQSTASIYMRFANQNNSALQFWTFRSIQQRPDRPRRKRRALLSPEEKRQIRTIAREVVDAGYHAVAKKLHPDLPGGSTKQMQGLNQARDVLVQCIRNW
jgi:hypothetical protein